MATSGKATYNDDECLPEVFRELLRPTFMTLNDAKPLERCIRGTTQNPNECLNSMVWVRCPKLKHHGAKVVRFAAASAVCHFHDGAECRKDIMEKLSIPGGVHTRYIFQKRTASACKRPKPKPLLRKRDIARQCKLCAQGKKKPFVNLKESPMRLDHSNLIPWASR